MTEGGPLLGGVSDVAKALIEKVSEGVAGLARPWHIERVARAEANATIIKTGAELNATKLRALAKWELTELEERALTRLLGFEERNQRNIEAIIAKAITHLDAEAKPQDITTDWITHVFEKCKTVADEDMQALWSRIIASEATQPGSFSKRAIETIAILDKRDAELFTALCGFGWKIGKRIIPLYCDIQATIYKSKSITFDSMNHLVSLGLLSFTGTSQYHLTQLPQHIFIQYFGVLCPAEMTKPTENILPIGLLMLTPLGTELAQICGATPVDGFLDYAAAWWKQNGVSILVTPQEKLRNCDWCKYLGKTSYSSSSWSEGAKAIHLCHEHFTTFQLGMGDTTQEMQKVWNHEAINAWKEAGYPKPRSFFDEWKRTH